VANDDQKAAAKALIRLGLSVGNAMDMAVPGHVNPDRLDAIVKAVEAGLPQTSQDADVLGRFNAAIDAAMDAGFELGDQQYRNSVRVVGGVFAVALAVWAAALIVVAWDRQGLTRAALRLRRHCDLLVDPVRRHRRRVARPGGQGPGLGAADGGERGASGQTVTYFVNLRAGPYGAV
jgi:hypothetical protein